MPSLENIANSIHGWLNNNFSGPWPMLIEFAIDYGNDWFVIPVELDIGSLYRSRSLIITDTFGVRTSLQSASELREPFSTWRMFQHSHLRGSEISKPASNLFFLPPSLVKSLESQPFFIIPVLECRQNNAILQEKLSCAGFYFYNDWLSSVMFFSSWLFPCNFPIG